MARSSTPAEVPAWLMTAASSAGVPFAGAVAAPNMARTSMPRAASRVRKRSAVMTWRMPALAMAAPRASGLAV